MILREMTDVAELKTNALRILDKAQVPYEIHTYEAAQAVDGVTVAAKLGQPVERVFKTLVTRGKGGFFVFVVPAAEELDLKKAARAAGEKSVEMIPVKDIQQVTGYIRGGCSPVGMKKPYPTVIDSSAEGLDTIIVSAGRIGLQMELEPQALCRLIHAAFAPITKE